MRCGCASDRCSCSVVAGDGIVVSGTGSRSNPYVVEAIPSSSGGGEGGVSNRFSGEITAYGGTTPPTGWLLCDGTEVSRATYSALFGIIGTSYGAGDGATTFNLPDLQGAFPRGAGADGPRGDTGGSAEIVLTVANLPAHTHSINHTHAATSTNGTHDHATGSNSSVGGSSAAFVRSPTTGADYFSSNALVDNAGDHSHTIPAYAGTSGSTGSGTAINNLPPYVAVNYIVKT